MKVKVGVSNRHVHLTKEVYEKLFNKSILGVRNSLNQIGEFASTDTVDLQYKNKIIPHVRIVGPFRNECQVELMKSDLNYIGIDAPVRRSGDLLETPGITLINGEKKLTLDHGVIRAERHVHVPTSMENKLDLHERECVKIITSNGKFDANVKVSDNGYYELHIDKDEAQMYDLKSGDEVELVKCLK